MADFSKLVGDSVSLKQTEFGEMGFQRIAMSDQDENSLETTDMADSFIVDIENMSPNSMKDNLSANSRISVKLQRNLSRKGSIRGERNKTALASSGVTDGSSNGTFTDGGCDFDKANPTPMVCFGMKEHIDKQPQQDVTIYSENRCSRTRRYLKQRTSAFLDPRRVLFFFATLSSMGTILLIYFTLSVSKYSGDDNNTQAP